MGWAFCGTNRHGQEIGYGVAATCDEPGCNAPIDRGLGHLCGEMHDDSETCARYYCAAHQVCVQRCARCVDPDDDDEDEDEVTP